MRQSVMGVLSVNGEVLFVRRQNFLNVFPGYTSFPGGKVDKTDISCSKNLEQFDEDQKLLKTLERELQEELKIDLSELVQNGIVQKVERLAKAITPEFNPVRFENHYFLITLKEKIQVSPLEDEIKECFWNSPSLFLKEYQNDEHLVVPPMLTLMSNLDSGIKALPFDLDKKYDLKNNIPSITPVSSVEQFLPYSNTFPPANRTNCFLLKGDKVVLVDPSPKSDEECEKLINSIKDEQIDFIFLTHHHPDHHEYAPKIARTFNVSCGMSEDTHQRISEKWGANYFDKVPVDIYQEGDTLTKINNQKILLLATPGHDEGQLSIYPENLKWMIVSDLIQTVGTVVIQSPEGNMTKYFDSLERVIQMNPKVVIPSHGIAMGGVDKLKVTLEHRRMREKQIKELWFSGKNEEQILNNVYEGLEEKLIPYAKRTISAHLEKIKSEN